MRCINAEKLLPITDYDGYYVNLMGKSSPVIKPSAVHEVKLILEARIILLTQLIKQLELTFLGSRTKAPV